MKTLKTAIESHGEVETDAIQVYSSGPDPVELLRLGNGGAGHTGLLRELCKTYLADKPGSHSISWVRNHSRNTQLALLRGHIDVALTYERDQEQLAQSEGWSQTVGCAFHDHFVLVGPLHDPLGIKHLDNLEQALRLIAKAGKAGEDGAVWHARVDGSATMWKERSLWERVGFQPWTGKTAAVDGGNSNLESVWYRTSTLGPADALVATDRANAYMITDRSTLLRQTSVQGVKSVTVLFEPEGSGDVLLNTCFALKSESARSSEVKVEVSNFLDFLLGGEGQGIIAEFGRNEAGLSFFAPAKDGCASTRLRFGRPLDGKWIAQSTHPSVKPGASLGDQNVFNTCVWISGEQQSALASARMSHDQKQPHFAIHHEDLQKMIVTSFKITSVLEESTSRPYYHEACVYVPSEDSVYVTSNQHTTCEDSDQKIVTISKVTRDLTDDTWMQTILPADHIQMANGGVNHPNGGIIFCQQGVLSPSTLSAAIVHMSTTPPYNTKTLVDNYHGRPFNSPNDVVVHPPTGTIWFTDPSYGHAQGIRPAPKLPNQVYVYDPVTNITRAVADGFDMPNGLAFSPSTTKLYVTDTGRIRGDGTTDDTRPSTIYVFEVVTMNDGKTMTLQNRGLFAFVDDGVPDGIKCDTKGNVYSGCGDGVHIWNSSGVLLGKIVVPGGVANFCFGKKGEMFLCGESVFWVVHLDAGVEGALLKELGIATSPEEEGENKGQIAMDDGYHGAVLVA